MIADEASEYVVAKAMETKGENPNFFTQPASHFQFEKEHDCKIKNQKYNGINM